jgi:hypothetical protein
MCEPRGPVSVKGKGNMETWYLVGRRADPGELGSAAAWDQSTPSTARTVP